MTRTNTPRNLHPDEAIVPKGFPFNHFSLLKNGTITGSCLSTPHEHLALQRLREDTKEQGGTAIRIAYTNRPNYWKKEWALNC
jgi:hypothetical protein